MGKGFDIPCVGGKIPRVGGQKIMGRAFNKPWIGDQYTMGRTVKIPWVGGSI